MPSARSLNPSSIMLVPRPVVGETMAPAEREIPDDDS